MKPTPITPGGPITVQLDCPVGHSTFSATHFQVDGAFTTFFDNKNVVGQFAYVTRWIVEHPKPKLVS